MTALIQEDDEQARVARAQAFLDLAGRIPQYSFNNQLLILEQKPDATMVGPFGFWLKKKRPVRRGERGIAIIAPRFWTERVEDRDEEGNPVVREVPRLSFGTEYVFDISQTEGEPVTGPLRFADVPMSLRAGALQYVARKHGFVVETAPIPDHCPVKLNPHPADDAARIAVLAHLLAHWILHREDAGQALLPATQEIQAEATAYVVLKALGVEHPIRINYLALYGTAPDDIRANLEAVSRAARTILQTAEEVFPQVDPRVYEPSGSVAS